MNTEEVATSSTAQILRPKVEDESAKRLHEDDEVEVYVSPTQTPPLAPVVFFSPNGSGGGDVHNSAQFKLALGAEEGEPSEQARRRLLADSRTEEPDSRRKADAEVRELRVYRMRWMILGVVALLNFSNTMSWIAFAPVANFVDEFYGRKGAANWFSVIYVIITIPVGLFGMWSARRFGLRMAILSAGLTNGFGAALRLASSFLPLSSRFPVGMVGQSVASIAYPFIMFLPTKVAGAWFPDTQRSLATMVATMSNPLGVLVANVVSPQLVESVGQVVLVNVFTFVPSIVACLLAVFLVRTSEPPLPPSASAAQKQLSFWKGVKKVLTSRSYVILAIVMGGGIGMFNTIYTIMQQLLCPSGYSNTFAGLCSALMIIGGVFGATASSWFVDKTKLFEETMKTAMSLAVLFGICFTQLVLRPNLAPLIAATCLLFGFFGLATYPLGLEMGAECTFPVSETTSTGLTVLMGQVQTSVYVILLTAISQKLPRHKAHLEVCSVAGKGAAAADMTRPALVFCAIAAVLAVGFVLFFRPKLRRVALERQSQNAKEMATGASSAEQHTRDNAEQLS